MTDKLENTVMEEAASVGGKLSETAMQVKEKLTDFGRTATSKIDENRCRSQWSSKGCIGPS